MLPGLRVRSREELEMLRMNAVQNPTLEFGTVDFGTSDMIEMVKSGNGDTTASATSIRNLQRELAEARRQNPSTGNHQRLRALEDQAVTARTAASEAKTKLDRHLIRLLEKNQTRNRFTIALLEGSFPRW
jgi:hypothetical protein